MKKLIITTFIVTIIMMSFPFIQKVEAIYNDRLPGSGNITTVQVNIDNGLEQRYITAWNSAVSDWNSAQSNITFDVTTAPSGNLLSAQSYATEPNLFGRITYHGLSDSTTPFSTYLNTSNSNIMTSALTRRSTASHELGHALGLADNSLNPSIMNTSRNRTSIYTPQPTDITNVNFLYD
ncbi:zinc metalloprotease [Salisediminibacterium selenitireducens]|uniref:Peptidase M10A and M12B matrixin and adamalysin n=1 Tax=Bacillus selenitireducens (strain ATCC 700615 / DSM 15326 / MLS10) TaxID=439292 RepID=D6XYI3_BACIE|nr:hypothetical protein [Salisediminibacterium selenitireducens]ADI00252.1 hypothetical protein Bsel_2756 [[Bacillus] selenitireducens MLS10]